MSTAELSGVLATIGATPLIALERVAPAGVEVYAKLEKFNPGGSVKDRTALQMLHGKIRSGELVPGRSVVVESTSGNLGIGLAQICAYFGLDLICVVDARTTAQTTGLLRAYGAVVEVITEAPGGDLLGARIARVRELVGQLPDAFWPNQYANPLNAAAHELTMREIVDRLDGRIDYLFCSVSTGGTLRGCGQYLRQQGLTTKLVAVDAVGSAIFHTPRGTRLLPGHGAARRPPLVDTSAVSDIVHVSDLECVRACRLLVAREALLVGGSSGATLAALGKLHPRIPAGSRCVLLFPDDGNRYLDTIYSDSWVREHFGDLPDLAPRPRPLATTR